MITLIGEIAIISWLAVLAYQDWRWQRLPNVLTLGGALVALAARLGEGGTAALMSGVWGGIVCALFLLLPFIFHGAAAGDVKMLFAVGCAMGLRQAPAIILFTSLAGLLLVFAVLIWGHADTRRVKHYVRVLFDWRYDRKAGAAALPPKTDKACNVPYGIAIAVGAFVALLYGRTFS